MGIEVIEKMANFKVSYLFLIAGVLIMTCKTTDIQLTELFESEAPQAVLRQAPFSRGVNFSGWFESQSAQGIPFTRYAEQDFADVKSLGADVIRLPIRMHSMTMGAPDYTLDPMLIKFLDIAVDWAEKYQLYIIIDNHSFDPVARTPDDIDDILLKVWAQTARHFKDRSDYVIYEILNEPHGISDKRWGEIQGMAIETIRQIDTRHQIIVGGTDYNSIKKLTTIPEYSDQNLIYTFHFYDPHIFTHQGATWGEPSLASLSGVPFPADAKRMPPVPSDLQRTWARDALTLHYEYDSKLSTLRSTLDKVVTFSRSRGVPVFCGEFGVYMINADQGDRVRWYAAVTDMLDKRGIARTSWDYYGGFGVFNTQSGGDFNTGLNTDVVRALGFTPPPQKPQPSGPINNGFVIYDDYPTREHSTGYWGEGVEFSLYDMPAAEGEFAIRWGNADQYNAFWFSFDRNGDFSKLAADYCLEFHARAEKPVRFDVRFLNPESPSSTPWRMRYSIDEKILPPDGEWHVIRIPLKDMREHGAWVNATQEWLEPRGKFSWKEVKQLEFVAEDEPLTERIWFDYIRITE